MPEHIENLSYAAAEPVVWELLQVVRKIMQVPGAHSKRVSYDIETKHVVVSDGTSPSNCLWLDASGLWHTSFDLPVYFKTLLALYMPVFETCGSTQASDPYIIAHLGQSLDARIATATGDSIFVTGEQNRKHLHSLRALCDAVIVGAGTAIADDPRLTTRAVSGPNPVRVIIDPSARIKAPMNILEDAQAKTILLHQSCVDGADLQMSFGPKILDARGDVCNQVERLILPDSHSGMSVSGIVALLASRGLRRLFVEGGGVTVSKFFEANHLDRLHIGVAPLLVGEGVPALAIDGFEKMKEAHRPPHALYRMGDDILWDFDLGYRRHETPSTCTTPAKIKDEDAPSRDPIERIV